MATIEVAADTVLVRVQGFDRLLALASEIKVPLRHVSRVELSPPEAHDAWHGLRVGTNLPGVVTAGRFLESDGWAFWDVHDPAAAISIELHDDRYAKLVVGVADPPAAVRLIQAALLKMTPDAGDSRSRSE